MWISFQKHQMLTLHWDDGWPPTDLTTHRIIFKRDICLSLRGIFYYINNRETYFRIVHALYNHENIVWKELLIWLRPNSKDNTAVFIRHQSNVVELGKLIDIYCSERSRNIRHRVCRMSSLNRCTQVVEYINDLGFLALNNLMSEKSKKAYQWLRRLINL